MAKKYELTNITTSHYPHTLHRIKALKDFGDVKAGDLGGWVEHEENLSQEGTCWVYNEAKVFGDATIYDDAKIYDNARIYGSAMICEDSSICDYASVFGKAFIDGRVRIWGNANISGTVNINGNAKVFDNAWVFDNTLICGDAEISGITLVSGNATIFTRLTKTTDYLCLGPIGSRNDYVTFTKSDNAIYVATGCFRGTLEEFREAVKKEHGQDATPDVHFENYTAAIACAEAVLTREAES